MKVQIPEFLKIARPDSGISAKEIGAILGVKSSRVNALCRLGEIPQPDYKHKYGYGPLNPKYFWRADTIRSYLRGRAA